MAKKESAFDRIGKRLTPERLEKMRKRRLKARASLPLISQLGYYIGEEIVRKYLPTLSVDMLQTTTIISVTDAEKKECKRLEKAWWNKRDKVRAKLNKELKESDLNLEWWEIDHKINEDTKAEWDALRAYHEMLEEKYLPKTIECHFRHLNISERNMKKFKEVIGVVLWDCDCSHYSVDPKDIDVKADEDGYFTVITLKKA